MIADLIAVTLELYGALFELRGPLFLRLGLALDLGNQVGDGFRPLPAAAVFGDFIGRGKGAVAPLGWSWDIHGSCWLLVAFGLAHLWAGE